MSTGHQEQIQGRDVHIDDIEWKDHPQPFAEGGIRWKLLNVSPEMGSWTAIYDCPKGSYFARQIHIGPGEYFLTKGKMNVRGGKGEGGASAEAPAYGYEPCNAQHDQTIFLEDSEFYMTFLGPLNFIDEEGNTVALFTWQDVQGAWEAS